MKMTINWQFVLLWVGTFFFFISFNLILPELPDYLSSLGGGEYKGLIISLFTLSAGVSRPFTGKLTDMIGRKPIMYIGASLGVVILALYPVLGTLYGFLVLRFMHGFSNGFTPTAVTALVADIVPQEKRGQAIGIYGIAISAGLALGPAIGGYVKLTYDINTMFYAATFFGVLALVAFVFVKESLEPKKPFEWSMLRIRKDEIIEMSVLPTAIIMLFGIYGFGMLLTLIPDLSKELGIDNKGTFFAWFTISSLLVRLVAGKVSDRVGRLIMLKVSFSIMICAFILLALTTTTFMFYASALVLGFGVGMFSPTVMALNIDMCDPKKRGSGMATLYIAMEFGIGIGALLSGLIYGDNLANLKIAFWVCVGINIAGLIYLLLLPKRYNDYGKANLLSKGDI